MQPVHARDVARAVKAALTREAAVGEPIVVAGRNPLRYADFVRLCARAAGRTVVIVPVPLAVALAGARLSAAIPGLPAISPAEVLRTTEDKAHDITAMRERLGVTPMTFEEGIALAMAGPTAGEGGRSSL